MDPLKFYLDKYKIDISEIEKIIFGNIYTAVMLKNGNIGVCANQHIIISVDIRDLKNPNLDNIEHKIVINAYFNALLNYDNDFKLQGDIFDIIDFKSNTNIVMIGLFQPILKKFNSKEIKLHIFDHNRTEPVLTPMKHQSKYLQQADIVILTATSIANGSFSDLINITSKYCDIYILGPSSILDKNILSYRNIKGIFGCVFKPYDKRVLQVINEGYGTRYFIKFGKKVFLLTPDK